MSQNSASLKTIGVVGAGVMGRGVAQNLAQSGLRAVLMDHDPNQLEVSEAEIRTNLRFQKMLGQKTDDVSGNPLDRITFTKSLEALEAVDYVIENIVEKWDAKAPLYTELDNRLPKSVVFAANTSAIPITRFGSVTKRPDKVVGIHFMNPVPMKKTVELIRGYHTSEATIELTASLLESMGKQYVMVNDAPGFISNRVLMLTVNEAVFLLQDQVADAQSVDQVFRECFGHKMGPLETADLIGLDTILYSLEVLYQEFNDPKFRPCPLLRKLVDAGLHGKKTGKGFFEHPTA